MVEAFVGEAAGAQGGAVEGGFFELGGGGGGEVGGQGFELGVGDVDFLAERLDFLVGIETLGFVLQDHVGADAAFGEFADAVVIFGAVGVGVEVEGAGVAVVVEEFDEEEGLFDVGGRRSGSPGHSGRARIGR